jgi:intracellular multiplication protein IcmP
MAGMQDDKPSMMPLGIAGIAIFVVTALFLWHFRHAQTAMALMSYAWLQISWIGTVTWTLFHWAPQTMHEIAAASRHPETVTISQIIWWWSIAGWIYSPFIAGFSVWRGLTLLDHPILKIRRTFNLESFLKTMSVHSPATIPVHGLDLIENDPDEWKTLDSVLDWVNRHQLVVHRRFLRDKAIQLLVKQLGKPLDKSLAKMAVHEKTMLTIMWMRLMKETKPAQALLDALNRSCANPTRLPDHGLAAIEFERLQKTRAAVKKLAPYLRRHHYMRTLLSALHLEVTIGSVKTGKLPTSQFIWLKPTDRILYATLNTTLRRVTWIECAGVIAQMRAEKLAFVEHFDLTAPCVDYASDENEKLLAKYKIIDSDIYR